MRYLFLAAVALTAACAPVTSTIPMGIREYVPIRDLGRDMIRDVRLSCALEAAKANPKVRPECVDLEIKAVKLRAVDEAVLEALASQMDAALKQQRLQEAMAQLAEVMKFAASVYMSGGASGVGALLR